MTERKRRLSPKEALLPWQKAVRTPFFLIKTRKNNLSYNRFAIRVSKRDVPSAVSRNRVRRQLARRVLLWKDVGVDALFIALPPIRSLDQAALGEAMRRFLPMNE